MPTRPEPLRAPRLDVASPAGTGRDQMPGRVGLFVAGYFGLGAVWAVFMAAGALVGHLELLEGVVAGGFAYGLLALADRWRATELDALAVMAAFGSTLYVAIGAGHLASATGADGRLLFWAVVLTAVPAAMATLLWMPHPLLGANVAVGVGVGIALAPVGGPALSAAGAKALVLALVLSALGVIVDLRTGSRAGSLLHYSSVVVFAVADLIIAITLDDVATGLAIASLALGQLCLALLLRRRSWAVSGWVTFAMALLSVVGAAPAEALLGSATSLVAAVPLAAMALEVQRHGPALRRLLLDALPEELAAAFPG